MNIRIVHKGQLDARELMILESEVKNQGKSMLVAYILWYFLGVFGGHRFYLGKTGTAVAMIFLNLTIIGTFIWWIVDAFLVHKYVQDHNAAVEMRIVDQLLQQKQNQQPDPLAPSIS